jgi:trans-2,3-dihydro-3-hydroxyanthranilate isomerase
MARDYAIYDVFTATQLAGNPLAVIFDGEGLGDERMQAIAREMNLSETVFVLPPENPAHTARIRIFTPGRELPFAGHPTVGTAIALAERHADSRGVDVVSVLEENVGPVRCVVRAASGAALFTEFDLPKLSVQQAFTIDTEALADALCLNAADIGFENHRVSLWSAGVPFLMVPVRDRQAAGAIRFNPMLWQAAAAASGPETAPPIYAYCRGGEDHTASFHARMFAPDMGISEDPATGGAVAAMSGAIHHFDSLADGHHALMIEQGLEIGRRSHIHLHIDADGGKIVRARIGGEAIRIAGGQLFL